MTGHRCKHPILGVGEVVIFRSVVDKGNRHNADADWQQGVFLGFDTKSTQFIVGTKARLLKTSYHQVKRLTTENAYSGKVMDEVKATVFDYLLKGASAEYGPAGVSIEAVTGSAGGRGHNWGTWVCAAKLQDIRRRWSEVRLHPGMSWVYVAPTSIGTSARTLSRLPT